jgi:hypothetical protein
MSGLPEPPPGSRLTEPASLNGAGTPSPAISPQEAVRMLDSVGFIDHANLPNVGPYAHLVVGLRAIPTLRHFDPEVVLYWATRAGRGEHREISLTEGLAPTSDFSWGEIEIVDRLNISNTYLVFGGDLLLDRVGEMLVCQFVSAAPILRRGGHSQAFDDGAANLGGFFARQMIAIDFLPGFEQRLAAATPVARYAAFVADFLGRCEASDSMREAHASLITELRRERSRLVADVPGAWSSGLVLLAASGVSS